VGEREAEGRRGEGSVSARAPVDPHPLLSRRHAIVLLRLPLDGANVAFAFRGDWVDATAAASSAAAAASLDAALPSLPVAAAVAGPALLAALADPGGAPDPDAALQALLRCGAVARDAAARGGGGGGGVGAFCLAPPAAGPFIAALRTGRAALVRALKGRRYREAPERDVVTTLTNVRPPRLAPRYLVRDGLGSGAVVRVKAPGGDMLRLGVAG